MNWTVLKSTIAAGKTDYKIKFASQMWAARPHLANIFEKLLDQKTFILPAARILQPIIYKITPFSPVFANNRKTSNRNP